MSIDQRLYREISDVSGTFNDMRRAVTEALNKDCESCCSNGNAVGSIIKLQVKLSYLIDTFSHVCAQAQAIRAKESQALAKAFE